MMTFGELLKVGEFNSDNVEPRDAEDEKEDKVCTFTMPMKDLIILKNAVEMLGMVDFGDLLKQQDKEEESEHFGRVAGNDYGPPPGHSDPAAGMGEA